MNLAQTGDINHNTLALSQVYYCRKILYKRRERQGPFCSRCTRRHLREKHTSEAKARVILLTLLPRINPRPTRS